MLSNPDFEATFWGPARNRAARLSLFARARAALVVPEGTVWPEHARTQWGAR